MYINKLVLELLLHDGKQLTVDTLKQTLEKWLLVDVSATREMVERNEINITWIKKTKQISDILTKAGASPKKI